ncbi:substrate-binding and VWA domain-containing protein [Nocardioidaceae bacterium SCSIO 66511]|nr:substrate-binding and VWA domain-containing protein [Nocardioidaceae bacterium SCSIO 66511]
MEGRHTAAGPRTPRRSGLNPLVVGAAIVAFVVAVGLVIRWQTADGDAAAAARDCSGEVSVAASPEIADVVKEVVAAGKGCGTYDVTATSGAEVAKALSSGKGVPDVWIPDSTVEVDRSAGTAATAPVVLEASLASSPVVAVGAQDPQSQWRDVLATDGMRLGDPATNTPSVLALIAANAEAEADGDSAEEIKQQLVSVAQSGAAASDGKTQGSAEVTKLAAEGATTVATEQTVLGEGGDVARKLQMSVPDSGTLSLDYPLVLSATSDRREDTSDGVTALTEILTSEEAQESFAKAGFRTPDGEPIDGGVGDVSALTMPRTDEVASILSAWTLLSRPSRTLAVIDVSGSMEYSAGSASRMALTVEAAQAGQRLFPDGSSLGLWAFSVGLGDKDRDYLPLVPVRPLGAEVDGMNQRALLEKSIDGLIGRTGGGTGLYDSVLAAYRAANDSYDPDAVNSVVVLTDGENEDPGSVSLDKLLDTIEVESNPDRPVRIITIGITEDADVSALEAIAHVTGGSSHIAVNPDEITDVFIGALASRS